MFVRKSSGLVREVGLGDSLAIGVGLLLLVGVYSVGVIFLQAFPNGDLYVPLIAGAVTACVLAFAYAQLVSTFPRAGGEFVYASRIFTPLAGAVVGGALLVATTIFGALNIVQTDQIYVPFALDQIGDALNWHALQTFGTSTLAHKGAWVAIGLAIVIGCALVCLRPIHTVTRWIFWTFVLGVVAHFLIAIILLFESRTGFINEFNAASGGSDAYHAIITKAAEGGFHPGVKFGDVVALLPFGPLAFLGFTYANYAAGEIKRPSRTYKVAVFGAVAFGIAGLLLGWAAMRHAAGLDFLQSSASLQANDPDAYSKLTSVVQAQGGLAYATVAAGDPVTTIIIAVGTLFAWICNALAFFLLSTRIVFALSFDRLLPTKVADVSKRTHAPIYAVALVAVLIGGFTVLGNSTTILTLFRNILLIVFAILVVGSICAAALPYRRPELYAASPKVLRGRVLGVHLITIVGTVAALMFIALAYDVGSRIQYSGGYGTGSIITLAVVATAGAVLYAVSRFHLSRRGIDLRLAMRELPPE
jgi:APA family basic amino acid/polyamine antiporter